MIVFAWEEEAEFLIRRNKYGVAVACINIKFMPSVGHFGSILSDYRYNSTFKDINIAKDWIDSKLKELGYIVSSKEFDPKLKNML